MIYFKVTEKLNAQNIGGLYAVLNELFTYNELKHKPVKIEYFEKIEVSKNDTYFFFGCRFIKKVENKNIIPNFK